MELADDPFDRALGFRVCSTGDTHIIRLTDAKKSIKADKERAFDWTWLLEDAEARLATIVFPGYDGPILEGTKVSKEKEERAAYARAEVTMPVVPGLREAYALVDRHQKMVFKAAGMDPTHSDWHMAKMSFDDDGVKITLSEGSCG